MSRDPISDAPETVEQALSRAALHGRRAASEALLAARALLDALSLALNGSSAEERRILGLAARGIDELAASLAGGPVPNGLLSAIADALDGEIARWEARARDDVDARAVLRAYLGLREILWEFGVRPPTGRKRQEAEERATGRRRRETRDSQGGASRDERPESRPTRAQRKRPGDRRGRMTRVPVEG